MLGLRRAGEDDLGFILRTERLPGYDWFIGQWEEARHRAEMADASNAYLVGLDGENPAGFAILRQLDDPERNVYLQRFAAAAPGRGFGRAFLQDVTDWVFRETSAHRFWLQVKDGNDRALHVYRSGGFVVEGKLRETLTAPDGGRLDSYVLSMLRAEWSSPPASATT